MNNGGAPPIIRRGTCCSCTPEENRTPIKSFREHSVIDFIETVANNWSVIKRGKSRDGKRRDDGSGTFLIQAVDEHENTLFIELSKDNSYWGVNSGGIFRKGYSNKKETVAKTEPQQPNNAVSSDSSLSVDEQVGISSIEPNGESTVSGDKVTISSTEKQEDRQESSIGERIVTAETEVNTEPTQAQKDAGNYKKGHVQVGTFNVTIENPKGSVRRGTDASGKQWETTMQHTYGYIRGTEGVDGDHIDVFLSSDIDGWNGRKAFVVDQYNPDGTFDEHKVMLGFNDNDEAFGAYLSNYEKGWENGRRLDVTAVNLEDFEKWIGSSKRKTKPLAEYVRFKKSIDKTDNEASTPFSVGSDKRTDSKSYELTRQLVADAIGAEDVVEVSDAEAQAMLRSHGDARLMGSRTDRKMAAIAEYYADKTLDDNQRKVVDVFSGKADNQAILVERPEGKCRVVMRQGREPKAGTKHSLFRHYKTAGNYIKTDDFAKIPEVIAKGERGVTSTGITYDLTLEDGTRLRVTTKLNDRREEFTNFLSNRKPPKSELVKNTQLSARASNSEVSDAKLGKSDDNAKFLKTASGVVYGWTSGGKVYLNRDMMNPETPLHEYTHLWDAMVRERNAELWARGVELMKQTPLWDEVVNDPRYVDISADENAIASEVHARLVGKDGAAILDDMIKRAGTDGAMAVAEAVTLKDKIQKWLSDMFNALRGTFSKFGENSLKDLTADDFNNMTLRDLVDKIDPNTEIKRGRQAERINRTNRMTDDVHTGIRTAEDVKSFDKILSEVESYGDTMYPDMGLDMMREAKHTGFITVYSSKPIRDGVFVTPSRMNAEDYAGGGRVYSRRVKVDDVAWIDDSEGQLATVSEGEKSPILMSTADDDILMRSTETEHKVISDADYSKLSEVERDVLDKYLSKRKSAGLSVIETQEDIAALNLNEDARRELTEFFNDKENIACYFKPTKNIYIFADRTAEGIGADLFHENMHALVDDLSLNDGSFLREFREQILDMPGYADMLRHNLYEEIVGMYEPDIVDEEFFSYVNMWAYAKPEVRPLISDCLRGSTKEYYQSVVQNHEYYKATEDLNRYDQTKGLQQLRQSSGNAADESAENEREGGETRVVGRGNARGKIRQEEAEGSERHEGLYPGIHEYGRGRRSGIADEIESLFNQAARGDLKGKPIEIGRLTEEGRNYLERLSGVAMKKDVSFVLNPSDLAHINRRHFGKNEKDGRNIPLTKDDIREIVNIVSNPDRVIYGKETTGSQRNMFFFLKECSDGSYKLMEIYSDRRGNLTAKSFFKSKEGVSQRAMSLITESSHLTSITDGATLSDGAKLPKFFSDSKQSAVEKRPGVDNFENPTVKKKESLERQGDGYGSYSDAEVSYENDPVSKVMGANRFSKKRQAEFAARERQRMAERIQELSELMHLDNVGIVTDASQLEGRRAKAKGFYSKRTGRITIIIPNHVSTIDVEQTLLHEAVAHYGLRRLFGRQFDTFLDNVYQSADESIRSKITEMAAKNSWDFRTATEEYLAGLAEDINYDEAQSYSGWWIEIKRLFFDMLEKIGFRGFSETGIEITDNELRYLLWRSYQNLVNPGRYRAFEQEAADVAMQYKFEVGNYAPMEEVTDGMVAEAGELNDVNERFNEALQRWEAGEMDKNEIIQIGAPLGIMKTFLPDLPIVMRQRILSKASYTKHNVDTKSLINLPRYISDPIFVFQRNENTLGIFTEMKDRDGKNICVAVELNKKIQHGKECLEVNDIRSIHGRDNENIIKPIISNNTLRYANKKKGLAWLSSASSNYQQEIDRQDLDSRIERPSSATRYVQYEIDSLRTNPAESERIGLNLDDAAKIVENFENPTVGKHNNNAVARDGVAEAGELNDVNERFNEQLSELREDNADKTILNLGMPSAILLAGGVSDRPMKLYGNKIIKKMKKHGFRLSELRNLPNAVANPIAVFNNLGRDGNRSILTELKTANGNFLVTIDLGKGGDDIDFNVVSSVFGKGENKVINWIEKGYIGSADFSGWREGGVKSIVLSLHNEIRSTAQSNPPRSPDRQLRHQSI